MLLTQDVVPQSADSTETPRQFRWPEATRTIPTGGRTVYLAHQKIDTRHKLTFRAAVGIFRRICCFLLLAVWLTATQHCGLEAAGIEFLAHTSHPSDSCAKTCADDACHNIEGVSYPKATSCLRLLPPEAALANQFVLLVVPPFGTERPLLVRDGATPEIVAIYRTWRFERRSALPARAPNLVA